MEERFSGSVGLVRGVGASPLNWMSHSTSLEGASLLLLAVLARAPQIGLACSQKRVRLEY